MSPLEGDGSFDAVDSIVDVDAGDSITSADTGDKNVSEDESISLGESDETGDIDIDAIQAGTSGNLGEQIEGEANDVGEEFDYKTSMMSSVDLGDLKNDSDSEESSGDLGFSKSSDEMNNILSDVDSVSKSLENENANSNDFNNDLSNAGVFDGEELIHAKAVIETVKSQRDKIEEENADLKKQLLLLEKDNSRLKEN